MTHVVRLLILLIFPKAELLMLTDFGLKDLGLEFTGEEVSI